MTESGKNEQSSDLVPTEAEEKEAVRLALTHNPPLRIGSSVLIRRQRPFAPSDGSIGHRALEDVVPVTITPALLDRWTIKELFRT